MHEYSIVGALIESIERLARERRACSVRGVFVSIGELSGVEPDLLATAYETFRERTICETAKLTILPVVARWDCPECRQTIARGAILECPQCRRPARLAAGDEIVLERIEMEVA
ncbi:MAG TPA: hydrogenase maturation nickel metallochaperone HypA [Thermoanaerobaculia bacterium]|nr:hydrogenase maturation nickel metallochaperone HypA [Thermoanaerobaculia bacterium]